MKLVRFQKKDGSPTQHGVLADDLVRPLEENHFLNLKVAPSAIPLADVRLLAPIIPPNLLCLGRNYGAHPDEQNSKKTSEPLLFLKATTTIIGPEDAIRLPAASSEDIYFEAELAVVIRRTARKIATENVLDYVLGYTVCNDLGAKGCQARDGQWARAKSFDTFAPMGPWIETDLNPSGLRISSRLNGKLIQDSTTDLMFFDVAATISFLSHCLTLLPGTVISMGSPGVLQEPRPFLRPGDMLESEVEGIGTLRNPVRLE